jgi:dienelactone hydrolase
MIRRSILLAATLAMTATLLLKPFPLVAQEAAPVSASVMEPDPAFPGYTIYRPALAERFARPLPIIAWGNGGCINAGNRSEVFLREVAARGYFIIAPGTIVADSESDAAEAALGQYPATRLVEAIDLAFAENRRAGGHLAGRLDETKVIAMGRSCGGLQAIVTAGDPRVTGLVVINSGIIRNGGVAQADGSVAARSYLPGTDADLARLHTPVLYLVGGPSDQAFVNAERDFELIDGQQLFYGNMDVGHAGTFQQPAGGAMGRAAIQWLEWQNHDDGIAGENFLGSHCILCGDPEWITKRKGL